MARIAGKGGSIEAGGGAVVGMDSWSLDYTCDTVETTAFDSAGIKSFIAGCTGWSGSASGKWDTTESKLLGATPTLVPGATVTVNFKLSATSGNLFTGSAIVTKWSPSMKHDGVVEISIDFQGTGALTEPTA